MALIRPLDFFSILVEKFAGNVEVFFVVAFILILIGAAYFNMPNIVLGAMLITFIVIFMNTEIGQGSILTGFFILAIILIGISFAFSLRDKIGN